MDLKQRTDGYKRESGYYYSYKLPYACMASYFHFILIRLEDKALIHHAHSTVTHGALGCIIFIATVTVTKHVVITSLSLLALVAGYP